MTRSKQTEVIILTNKFGIYPDVVSDFFVRFKNPKFEIRTYGGCFDIYVWPKKPINVPFFCVWCKDIKELENNILMLTKLL